MGFWGALGTGVATAAGVTPWDMVDDLWGGSNQERAVDQYNSDQKSLSIQNMQMQKEFAQNGIRWRVADAEAAGLHPLAALGSSGSTYSPVGLFTDPGQGGPTTGESLRQMGQGIDRAINVTRTKEEKLMADLSLMKAKAEVDYVHQQIAESNWRMNNPVGPNAGLPGGPWVESKTRVPEFAFSDAGPGRIGIQPSNEFAMRNSANFFDNLVFALKKRFYPPPSPDSRYKYLNRSFGEYADEPSPLWNPGHYLRGYVDMIRGEHNENWNYRKDSRRR